MAQNISVPDIGDFKDVEVIEVLVKPGDQINKNDPIVTIESDKSSLEIPSPSSGEIKDLKVKIGDKVSEGSVLATIENNPTISTAKEKKVEEPKKETPIKEQLKSNGELNAVKQVKKVFAEPVSKDDIDPIETDEWIEYTVIIDSSATYNLDSRIATEIGEGEFNLELNGVDITGQISVESTGGWQTWETINTYDIELTEGKYVLRFNVTKGGFNLNYFRFYYEGYDCNNNLDGTASLDVCGVCSGGETGITPSTSELDCVIGLINKQEYSFEVYPNPSSNYIHIESEQAISEWVLSDPLGTTILKGNSIDINIESLADGIYILMVDGKSKKIEKY